LAQITLFSETDKHGRITFVNEAFCEVSKYEKEELLDRPHSIIRHPDMPGKLFELLWSTIKREEIFRAIIKNRAKDNSHYWVQATIMPVVSNSKEVVKYVGVRHLIKDEEEALAMYTRQARDLGLDFPLNLIKSSSHI
jgi:PAS domain S-box-containing protein